MEECSLKYKGAEENLNCVYDSACPKAMTSDELKEVTKEQSTKIVKKYHVLKKYKLICVLAGRLLRQLCYGAISKEN